MEDQNQPLTQKIKKFIDKKVRETVLDSAIALLLLSLVFGFVGGMVALYVGPQYLETLFGRSILPGFVERRIIQPDTTAGSQESSSGAYQPQTSTEDIVISIVRDASPSVVSVIASKDLPIFEQYYMSPFGDDPFFNQFFPELQVPQQRQRGTERQEVSAGTGFMAASNLIITNKHVVSDTSADYTVVTTAGGTYEAKVIARDPVEDLAILQVNGLDLAPLKLGDSDKLAPGQSVIAIGNALGEFQNSVSMGVVSGLKRTLTASGGGVTGEVLREVIQTDTAINPGNSGGPLINLSGEVIAVNVALAQGAENIAFSVPINRIKNSLEQARTTGVVRYPFLGVRYLLITPDVQKENSLPVDYGALVVRGQTAGSVAVVPGSAADKAGIVENDILLEIDGKRITASSTLAGIIAKYKVGDTISLKILHKGEEQIVQAVLSERP